MCQQYILCCVGADAIRELHSHANGMRFHVLFFNVLSLFLRWLNVVRVVSVRKKCAVKTWQCRVSALIEKSCWICSLWYGGESGSQGQVHPMI